VRGKRYRAQVACGHACLWGTSSTTNADAAQRMQAIFATQLLPVIAEINPKEPLRRAGLVATQMLGLALCRYVLKLPPVVEMSREEVVSWLGPTVQRYID